MDRVQAEVPDYWGNTEFLQIYYFTLGLNIDINMWSLGHEGSLGPRCIAVVISGASF